MATKKADPKHQDGCPVCGSPVTLVPPPTNAERAAAANRDNPVPLNPLFDTATEQQLATLGPLYRCTNCDYRLRVLPQLAGAAAGTTGD